eukprot:c24379_g1_i1 orf=2773-4053(+)
MSRKSMLQIQVTVPSYFVCPISLELMNDPVTLSSGQTFDRPSIEKWLDDGHNSCPVTRLRIDPYLEDPIPNHALRRMIQDWCVQHKSFVDRVLTPRQPPSLKDIPALVDRLAPRSGFGSDSLDALQTLTRLAFDRPVSRRNILQSGALSHLSKILSRSYTGLAPLSSSITSVLTPRTLSAADEALQLLDLLTDSDQFDVDCKQQHCDEELVMALANALLRTGKADSRLKVASILIRMQLSDSLKRKMGEMQGFIGSLVEMIREQDLSSKAVLGLFVNVCSVSNRNRVAATKVEAVDALAESLAIAQGSDKATMELTLKALEVLSQCAEGRAAIASNVRILVAVVKQMNSLSERAAHHAILIVLLVVKWAPDAGKVKSLALQEGALLKAVAVAQSAAASETRLVARKLISSLSNGLPPDHLSHTMRL